MSFTLFNDSVKVLPGLCKPYDNEILSSWIARIAFYHGLTSFEFYTLVLSHQYVQSYDLDRAISKEKINVLAERTNCTASEVEATTLLSYCDHFFTTANLVNASEVWLLPSVKSFPKERFLNHESGLMFCPLCLKKKAYFKKHWRLALSFVCLDCGCYLLDKCPHCAAANSFLEVMDYGFLDGSLDNYLLNCRRCGMNITECNIEMASKKTLSLQRRLYHLIDANSSKPLVHKKSYWQVLYDLSRLLLNPMRRGNIRVKNFAQDVYELNGVDFNEYMKLSKNDLRKIDVRKRSEIIGMGQWLLLQWPRRFIGICSNNNVDPEEILELFLRPPVWFYEPIYEGLIFKRLLHARKAKRLKKEPIDYTAKPSDKRIKTIDYDFAMDEEYDENEIFYEPPVSKVGH
jgi:hypothetical protein